MKKFWTLLSLILCNLFQSGKVTTSPDEPDRFGSLESIHARVDMLVPGEDITGRIVRFKRLGDNPSISQVVVAPNTGTVPYRLVDMKIKKTWKLEVL